ncbi:MAG: hypothetical protein RLZZ379_1104 [Pseudomonadota bacterium]
MSFKTIENFIGNTPLVKLQRMGGNRYYFAET